MSLSFRESPKGIPLGKVTKEICRNRNTRIQSLRVIPSPLRTRRFRRDPINAELKSSKSAAMCEGDDACVRKTAGLQGGVCESFSSACALANIARVPIPRSSLLSQWLISFWLSFYSFSGIRERRDRIELLKMRYYRSLLPCKNG